VPIGRWVLSEALGQAARWSSAHSHLKPLKISVNVSAVQLRAPSLIADVRDALLESEIDPGRVILEVTESSFIEGSQETIRTLRGLKELGVLLAIDDFGTGYASISNLRSMPSTSSRSTRASSPPQSTTPIPPPSCSRRSSTSAGCSRW